MMMKFLQGVCGRTSPGRRRRSAWRRRSMPSSAACSTDSTSESGDTTITSAPLYCVSVIDSTWGQLTHQLLVAYIGFIFITPNSTCATLATCCFGKVQGWVPAMLTYHHCFVEHFSKPQKRDRGQGCVAAAHLHLVCIPRRVAGLCPDSQEHVHALSLEICDRHHRPRHIISSNEVTPAVP